MAPNARKRNDALHQRIRTELERKIVNGTWPPGYRIPYEHELMTQYSCSRMTVNKVLSRLASIGLIERRRRAGSFVSRPKVHSAVLEIPDIQAEIVSRSQKYSMKLIQSKRRRATKQEAIALRVTRESEVLYLACCHFADGHPFAYEERLINLSEVPDAAGVDFSKEPPGTWLLGHIPWTEADHRITSVNAGKEYAKELKLQEQTACLLVERRTWRAGQSITHVKQIFPGTQYYLTAHFTPAQHF